MEAFLPSNKREDFLLIERAQLEAKVREVREARKEPMIFLVMLLGNQLTPSQEYNVFHKNIHQRVYTIHWLL